MKTDKRALSVYIHIPFCIRKCLYCDFLSAPATDEMRARYLKCLSSEIERESHKYCAYKVRTVFVGGGTPSLLSGNEMKQLLECVKLNYDVAVPYKELPFNRENGFKMKKNFNLKRKYNPTSAIEIGKIIPPKTSLIFSIFHLFF